MALPVAIALAPSFSRSRRVRAAESRHASMGVSSLVRAVLDEVSFGVANA
jgi:hypothetical protein